MNISNSKNFIRPTFTANVMPKDCAEHIDNKLKTAKTVDIFCHNSSDEDAFNSAKAMYSYLKEQGIAPRIVVSCGKENYQYDVNKFNIIQANDISKKTHKADMALCVDFSSPVRVQSNVLNYLNSYGSNIVGFDHHNDSEILVKDYNKITQSYAKNQTIPHIEAKDYYIDTSAKSNCAIISRFFDAIGHKTTKDEARSLFAGMLDDTSKDGFAKLNKLGQVQISSNTNDNGNTKEVMKNILSNLNIFDKLNVLKHFADKTKLTAKEIAFSKTLDTKTKYTNNGKYAYLEITPNDKDWEELGKDTTRTKIVLQQFRKDTLKKGSVDAVAVFYPTNDGIYKMSILTQKDYAKQIIDNIKATTCPNLVAGGHENRSGGTINTQDAQKCQEWVNLFRQSADEILGK